MADGYARAVRGLGVCMSTVGPGAMNLVSGLAASFKAGVPVLAVTGIHDHHILELDSFHEMDRGGGFRPYYQVERLRSSAGKDSGHVP